MIKLIKDSIKEIVVIFFNYQWRKNNKSIQQSEIFTQNEDLSKDGIGYWEAASRQK